MTIKRKLVFALLMIVLIPVGLIGWLGVRVAIEDQESVRRNLLNLLNSRLEDIRGQVTRTMEAIELELLKGLDAHYSTIEKLQTFETKNDLVRQTFLVDASGRLIYPNPKKPATLAERRFLLRTRSIWHQKAILDSSGGVREMPNLMPKKQVQLRQKNPSPFRRPNPRGRGDSIVDLAATRGFGWIDWYWAEGLHLLFWKRRIGGGIVGVEVDRIVLMSRIVGELPDSSRLEGRIVLMTSRGMPIYQWGEYNPTRKERPLAQVALRQPLQSWILRYYGPQTMLSRSLDRRVKLNLAVLLLVVVAGLLALAFYLYREYTRELREASRRVNFVTQVSHELKTPLTNIRLYAELLEGRVDPDDERAQRNLHVIVNESQRLTRLIQNILSFSKNHKGTLSLNRSPIVLDDVVSRSIEQFRPSLEAKGIAIETALAAPDPIVADPDAVEQILGNLLSNVEKYAADGGFVSITTATNDDGVELNVRDRGEGIPSNLRRRLFEPFVRGSNRLSDGVTGTGIGLSIARELARLHGGELRLHASSKGAHFVLTLPKEETNRESVTG